MYKFTKLHKKLHNIPTVIFSLSGKLIHEYIIETPFHTAWYKMSYTFNIVLLDI